MLRLTPGIGRHINASSVNLFFFIRGDLLFETLPPNPNLSSFYSVTLDERQDSAFEQDCQHSLLPYKNPPPSKQPELRYVFTSVCNCSTPAGGRKSSFLRGHIQYTSGNGQCPK